MNDQQQIFLAGCFCGCFISMLIGFIWMGICNIITPKHTPPKEHDPADWWKDV